MKWGAHSMLLVGVKREDRRRGGDASLWPTPGITLLTLGCLDPWEPRNSRAKGGWEGMKGGGRGGALEKEKGCKGCMDVTAQPLKGDAKPPHRSPCDDFTSTVTPLDPDTPFCPTQKNLNPLSPALQLLVPIGPPRAAVAEGTEEWTERRRAKEKKGEGRGGGGREKGAMQKVNCWSEVFLLGVQEGGSGSGSTR